MEGSSKEENTKHLGMMMIPTDKGRGLTPPLPLSMRITCRSISFRFFKIPYSFVFATQTKETIPSWNALLIYRITRGGFTASRSHDLKISQMITCLWIALKQTTGALHRLRVSNGVSLLFWAIRSDLIVLWIFLHFNLVV